MAAVPATEIILPILTALEKPAMLSNGESELMLVRCIKYLSVFPGLWVVTVLFSLQVIQAWWHPAAVDTATESGAVARHLRQYRSADNQHKDRQR